MNHIFYAELFLLKLVSKFASLWDSHSKIQMQLLGTQDVIVVNDLTRRENTDNNI